MCRPVDNSNIMLWLFCGIVAGVGGFFKHDLAVTLYQKNAVIKSRNTHDIQREVPDEGRLTRVAGAIIDSPKKY